MIVVICIIPIARRLVEYYPLAPAIDTGNLDIHIIVDIGITLSDALLFMQTMVSVGPVLTVGSLRVSVAA